MRSRRTRLTTALAVAAAAVIAAPSAASADVYRDAEWWIVDYGISEAWKTTRGEGVTIAVLDTGIDGDHPDLHGAVVGGADMTGEGSPDGQKPLGLDGEHGTMVASLLAGRPAGSTGVMGVAPASKILSVSMSFELIDSVPSDQQIANGIRWSVDHGADIIVMSFTRNTLGWPTTWDDAFRYAADNDVLIVAATGNRASGTDVVGAPATIPGVLVVAGATHGGSISNYSSAQGVTVAVAAASEGLVGSVPGGARRFWTGTSGAAPIVAGIAALVMSAHPDLDVPNVINRIISTAHAVGSDSPTVQAGYGIVDAAAAVNASVPSVVANPLGDLGEWITQHRETPWESRDVLLPSAIDATPSPAPAGDVALQNRATADESWRSLWLPVTLWSSLAAILGAIATFITVRIRALRRATGTKDPHNTLN
ncbi:MAG: hypothetical protein RIS25_256 [Actinomycetota bacterium]|jgi:subtilisin family serine protease